MVINESLTNTRQGALNTNLVLANNKGKGGTKSQAMQAFLQDLLIELIGLV